jgi:hypothetical protein
MVRNYKRKKVEEPPNEENIMQGIKDYEDKKYKSVRAAAKAFGIKYRTFSRRYKTYIKNNNKSENETNLSLHPTVSGNFNKYAAKQIYTTIKESLLSNYIIKRSQLNYGMTFMEIREFAYKYAVKLGKRIPTSWTSGEVASEDCLSGFMFRNKSLSLRKPESTSLVRNLNFNPENVNEFHNNLENIVEKHNFVASQIYNIDECGVQTVMDSPNVVAEKGAKQVGQMTSGEKGPTVTFVGIINAAGKALPPCYVFPRVRPNEAFVRGAPNGSIALLHPSGYMTGSNFLVVMQHIQKHTGCSIENPILLLLDNHESHCNFDVIIFCRENGIHLLTFPPHTTHKLQPLDVAIYGPMKTYIKQEINRVMKRRYGSGITIYDVGQITKLPFEKAFTEKNIKSAFMATGIWPQNRGKFTTPDFVAATVFDRPEPDSIVPPAAVSMNAEEFLPNTPDSTISGGTNYCSCCYCKHLRLHNQHSASTASR